MARRMRPNAAAAPSFRARAGWLEYDDWRGEQGTVVGRVLVRPGVRSPKLDYERHILAYLPPTVSAGASRDRYPVVYMHDGQNLFDVGTSDRGEWRVDETMEQLAREGIEAIVVAIPNAEAAEPVIERGRWLEYSPHVDERGFGGGGDDYLAFLVNTVKPLVDDAFPTRTDAAGTGIAGSSMGALISLHALAARPDVFGFAGLMSPALWFADGPVLRDEAPLLRPGRPVYIDVGGREGDHLPTPDARARMSRRYLEDARALRGILVRNGFVEGRDLLYVEELSAPHHQSAWARRLPGMFRFLLAGGDGRPAPRSIGYSMTRS